MHLVHHVLYFIPISFSSPLSQGNALSLTNVVTYPHCFLTAYKRLWCLCVLAGTWDSKNPDLDYCDPSFGLIVFDIFGLMQLAFRTSSGLRARAKKNCAKRQHRGGRVRISPKWHYIFMSLPSSLTYKISPISLSNFTICNWDVVVA